MRLLAKLNIDGFILALLSTVAFASLVPAKGGAVRIVDDAVTVGIALLFFLYGARLKPREAYEGLKHWRLHVTILSFTFIAFPLIGLALRVLSGHGLTPGLYTGVLFLTLVPSTVQSSIAFTSISGGNVAGAMVSASASNLLGVFITPLLVLALMGTTGHVQFHGGSIIDIALQLLLPFVAGQIARKWIGKWVSENAKPLKLVDRGSIILVVYSAFSAGVREGIWHQVSAANVLFLIGLFVLIVAMMLWVTAFVARRLGFNRADMIAIQFCGTKKSLATGLPMASVLFVGQPVGVIVLPLMIFHQVQLMICAWLSSRYAKKLQQPNAPVAGPIS